MNKRIKKLAAPTEEETRIADLEVENARLQARVEEAERQLARDWESMRLQAKDFVALGHEHDRYKALVERHWRALQKWRMGGGHLHGAVVDTDKCPACLEFAAAIDAPASKAQRQAEDAIGYEEAARYDAEQAQQEADHRRDVA
ncbi:hypothetical protein LCGC14_1306520, partial [marine sediment metagenome]